MARNTDQRDMDKNIQYLRQAMSGLDEQIPIPEDVRGSALRGKLDNIYPTKAATPNKKSGLNLNLRWLSWQSGFSYAAAFLLIVSLFYGLGFNREPNIVDGNMQLETAQEEMAADIEGAEDAFDLPQAAAGETTGAADSAQSRMGALPEEADLYVADSQAGTGAGGAQMSPLTGGADMDDSGVGGGSVTLSTLESDGYSYTFRANDPTDPDKAEFPITIDIVEDETGELAGQIDLSGVTEIVGQYLESGRIMVIGQGENGVVSYVYDVDDPAQPEELAALHSDGAYVASRLYRDVLCTVTYTDAGVDGTLATEELPDSVEEGVCVIAAYDLASDEWVQKGFTGATGEISLHNVNAYITYQGLPDDGEEPEELVAQIRLDGTDVYVYGVG